MFFLKAINIQWDVDNEHDLELLPKEIIIPNGMVDEDEISDYISDVTGYCHKGYLLDCDLNAVLDGGNDIDMKKICGCESANTLNKCEKTCAKYHDCHNVALANDILRCYEIYSDEMKEKIKQGLAEGIVRIINNPNDDCIACEIGDYWFYFIGREYEDMSPDEVLETFTKEELSEMIYSVMQDLEAEERLYYQSFLEDNLSKKPMQANISLEENKTEFIGQIIDIFEDFLDEKKIKIPNEEREDEEDDDSFANIYGEDYFALEEKIKETLINWGVI